MPHYPVELAGEPKGPVYLWYLCSECSCRFRVTLTWEQWEKIYLERKNAVVFFKDQPDIGNKLFYGWCTQCQKKKFTFLNNMLHEITNLQKDHNP